MRNVIIKTEVESIARELEIQPGDILLSINGKEVKDVFDYRYMIQDEYIELEIEKPDGEQFIFEIEKDEDEDLGIIFESGLMDDAKGCRNKCIFCFIDQLPRNMRETLYFKDDDSRLSFLQGNYVTLTNMKREELERIIYYHLSPINISVHSTEPELRRLMLKNPTAGDICQRIEMLNKANIKMNFQIVLCKGVNDGVHLERTIGDLSRYMPNGQSLSVVPAGLTKYREGLHTLKPFTINDSLEVIELIEKWQDRLKREHGSRFVFAADEFYLNARKPLPGHKSYEDFPQLENGVGMLALLDKEFRAALGKVKEASTGDEISLITGQAAHKFIEGLMDKARIKFPGKKINVLCVKNNFFGEQITVSGLLTGHDIKTELKLRGTKGNVLIPENALRAGDTVFLDNMDIVDLERELPVKIIPVKVNGLEFVKALFQERN